MKFNNLIMYRISYRISDVAMDFFELRLTVVLHILSERLMLFGYSFGTFTIVREQRAFNVSIKPIRVDLLICRETLMTIRRALFYEYIASPLFCTDRCSFRRFYDKKIPPSYIHIKFKPLIIGIFRDRIRIVEMKN